MPEWNIDCHICETRRPVRLMDWEMFANGRCPNGETRIESFICCSDGKCAMRLERIGRSKFWRWWYGIKEPVEANEI